MYQFQTQVWYDEVQLILHFLWDTISTLSTKRIDKNYPLSENIHK